MFIKLLMVLLHLQFILEKLRHSTSIKYVNEEFFLNFHIF